MFNAKPHHQHFSVRYFDITRGYHPNSTAQATNSGLSWLSWGWAKVHIQPTILGTPTACPWSDGPMRLSEGWLQKNEDLQGVLKKIRQNSWCFWYFQTKICCCWFLLASDMSSFLEVLDHFSIETSMVLGIQKWWNFHGPSLEDGMKKPAAWGVLAQAYGDTSRVFHTQKHS